MLFNGRIRASVLIAGLVLCVPACSFLPKGPKEQPVPAFFGSAGDVEHVRRIMVLPFAAAPGVAAETDLLRRVFSAELAKIKRFEIVPLPHGADEEVHLYDSLRHGKISAEALAGLGSRYNLDGVLLGTVTGYRPYTPPHLGMRVQLLSLHSAKAVWAAETFHDASDDATVRDIRHYYATFLADDKSLHGWELTLISPSRFAAFVMHRIVGSWRHATP